MNVTSILGVCAALVMCGVSAAMNYLFLSSLGKTALDGHVLGAASASADVLKALLPFFIAWSWQARRFIAAAAGSLAFAFFAVFSLLSAIGFVADNRGVLVQARNEISGEYIRVQDMRTYAETQHKALPAYRAGDIVMQEIERHRQNRRWISTSACTDATEELSREYCAAYFSLRAELSSSEEAKRLTSEIKSLDAQLARLRTKGAGQDSDPQVSLLSRMTGEDKDAVRLALIIAVALLVEIGATLGLFLASGHSMAGRVAPNPEKEPASTGSVEDFALEALEPSSGALSTKSVAAAYRTWCDEHGYRPLLSDTFDAAFRDLARQAGIEFRNGLFQRIGVAASAFKQAA